MLMTPLGIDGDGSRKAVASAAWRHIRNGAAIATGGFVAYPIEASAPTGFPSWLSFTLGAIVAFAAIYSHAVTSRTMSRADGLHAPVPQFFLLMAVGVVGAVAATGSALAFAFGIGVAFAGISAASNSTITGSSVARPARVASLS